LYLQLTDKLNVLCAHYVHVCACVGVCEWIGDQFSVTCNAVFVNYSDQCSEIT